VSSIAWTGAWRLASTSELGASFGFRTPLFFFLRASASKVASLSYKLGVRTVSVDASTIAGLLVEAAGW